jgi:hypothetical protein
MSSSIDEGASFKPLIYAFEGMAKIREGAIKESILDVQ